MHSLMASRLGHTRWLVTTYQYISDSLRAISHETATFHQHQSLLIAQHVVYISV